MKIRILLLTSIVLLFSFNACSDDDNGKNNGLTQEQKNNQYVNEWTYENMDFWYYWRDKMAASSSLDYTVSPDDFFEDLLYPYNKVTYEGDRFSWIQASYVDLLNSLSGVSSSEIGFNYIPSLYGSGTDVVLIVTYIKKGTKAEGSGLKRGDVISKVDGTSLNTTNWSGALYQNKSSYKLEGINFSGSITVEPTSNYKENPIYLEQVITEGTTKIGYIVYNQFTMDNGDNTYIYDKQLADIFTRYINENVTNVVLDLRYNGGGYTSCATNIASALVPGRDTKAKFYYKDYNSEVLAAARREFTTAGYDSFINDYFKDNIEYWKDEKTVVNMGAIPRLGDKINKLYILVGNNTASASELVINGLKPFMDGKLFIVGDQTYGKNVGSISLYEENDSRNKWGIQPIVFKSFNKNGESNYANGFIPGQQIPGALVEEFAGIAQNGLKPLGDVEEPLLAYAIADITGKPKAAVLKRASAPSIAIKNLKPESSFRMLDNNPQVQDLIRKIK